LLAELPSYCSRWRCCECERIRDGIRRAVIVVEVNKQYRQDGAWILLLWRICVDVDDVDDDGGGSCFGNWHMDLLKGGANDV